MIRRLLLFSIAFQASDSQVKKCRRFDFQCFWDRSCIPRQFKCDRKHDCPNGEDETEWFAGCETCRGMFHCHKDPNGPVCIDKSLICDGYTDCLYGEDETFEFAKCENKCQRNLVAAERAGRQNCRKSCQQDSNCNRRKKKTSRITTQCKVIWLCRAEKEKKEEKKKEEKKVCICDYECGKSCVTITKTCPALEPIPHLRSIRYVRVNRGTNVVEDAEEPFQYDVQAHHTCGPGFEAHPTSVRICHGRAAEKNATWTSDIVCTPSCDEKSHRRIQKYNLSCGKNCIVDKDCVSGKTCTCDGACGKTCVKLDVECGEAPAVENALVEYTGEKIKRVAHYICVEGTYLAKGDISRKCTGSGKWEGEPVKCEAVTCLDPLPSISRMGGQIVGYVTPPYYFNTTLEFACGRGQRLLGSRIRTCMNNGRWSGMDTICDNRRRLKRCSHPGIPIGGELMSRARDVEFVIGKVAEFRCNDGLVMIGEAKSECLFYRQWSGDGVPLCVDPRYSDGSTDVIKKLSESTANIKSNPFIQTGKAVKMNSRGRIELYFVIDLSQSIKEKHLENLIDFAKGLIKRISRNDTANRLRYGIVVFGTFPRTMLNIMDEPPARPKKVLDRLEEIKADFRSIRKKHVQYGTNIQAALRELDKLQLANSYRFYPKDIVKRHIFIMTDGAHNAGGIPSNAKMEIEKSYQRNVPEFYSITSSAKDQSFEVREELQNLATNEKNFIYVEDFYKLHKYIDQVTDVREEYTTCGKAGDIGSIRKMSTRGRVLGGNDAVERAWPWQAVISYYNQELSQAFSDELLIGGGSLISNKWVLTATHLFTKTALAIDWEKEFMVTLGITRRPFDYGAIEGSIKIYQPEKIITHEKYEMHRGKRHIASFQNDVALIKLGGEITIHGPGLYLPKDSDKSRAVNFVEFTPYIRPVCLPCSSDSCVSKILMKENSEGRVLLNGDEEPEERCRIEYEFLMGKGEESMTAVMATGFGHNATRKDGDKKNSLAPSKKLRQAVLRVLKRESCNEAVRIINGQRADSNLQHIFTDQMFCAVGAKNEHGRIADTCHGDSGGPLVREVHDDVTKESCFVQVGIVSWGYGCGQSAIMNSRHYFYPGFYTDVTSMLSWINKTMKKYAKKKQ